ncbi:hypothetical protein ACL1CU_10785, partial [Corynebacterium striatum]
TQHQRIVVPPTSTMKENPLQYRVRGTPVPTTRTRGTNYPKSTLTSFYLSAQKGRKLFIFDEIPKIESVGGLPHHE